MTTLLTSSAEETTGSADRRDRFGILFWISVGWVAIVALAAILANVLPLPNPNAQIYSAVNARPSIHHLLGTDDLGRDLLSRLVFGARVSLVVGFGSMAIGMAIGGPLGMWAGFRRGFFDHVANAIAFVLLAFPPILAVIAITAFWHVALWKITVILGGAAIPLVFVVVRASTLSTASNDYVLAARALGAGTPRILFREILPNVLPATISFAMIGVALAIITEGSLAFLGLSVQLPTPSWGNLIAGGSQNGNLQSNIFIMLWPVLAMFTLLMALNIIGDRIRQRYDVREGLL